MNENLPRLVGSFVDFYDHYKGKKTYRGNNNENKKHLYDALRNIKDRDSFVDKALGAAEGSFANVGKPLPLSNYDGNFLSNLKNMKGHEDKCLALHYHILDIYPGEGCELNKKVLGKVHIKSIFERNPTNVSLPQPAELPPPEQAGAISSPQQISKHENFVMPDAYVSREDKLRKIKEALLGPENGRSVALTTMLHGFGGFGKSTLAKAIYKDHAVREAFPDGVFWVQCQQDISLKVEALIASVLPKIDPSAQVARCVDDPSARQELAHAVGDKRVLLIVDDVWYQAHANAFRDLPATCAVLMTTRMKHLAWPGSTKVHVDEMTPGEAVDVLKWGLDSTTGDEVYPVGEPELSGLKRIAHQLGYWAQLLGLANGWLREAREEGFPLAEAANDYLSLFAEEGITVADSGDTSGSAQEARARNMEVCIEASLHIVLKLLGEDSLSHLLELSVLPKDLDIPMAVIVGLWWKTGQLSDAKSRSLIRRLARMSLLQVFRENEGSVSIHDNLVDYLSRRLGAKGQVAVHRKMVASLRRHCPGGWASLPADHEYGWTHLLTHLAGANEQNAVDDLRTDYAWLKAKLEAVGALELYRSFLPVPNRADAAKTGRAVALSLPVISKRSQALPLQLYGRLGHEKMDRLSEITASARKDPQFYPAPVRPHLLPLGAEIMRFVGHGATVSSAVFSADGTRVLTASDDATARLWDKDTGQEVWAFEGHGNGVVSVVFSACGTRVLTSSDDGTARLWDAETGHEIRAFEGHGCGVTNAVFSADETRVLTSSEDGSARLWDTVTGDEIVAFEGHDDIVKSAVFSADGTRVLTSSYDWTARLWDTVTGQEIFAFEGHGDWLNSAVFSADSTRVLTSSDDGTAQLWDTVTGREIRSFEGHSDGVNSAVFSADGTRVLTSSDDGTARLWDTVTGREIRSFEGHGDAVNSAVFSADGTRVLTSSGDRTTRLWDTETGQEIGAFTGHGGWVNSAVFSADGTRVLTSSVDGTGRLWDTVTGQEIGAFERPRKGVASAVAFADGTRALTGSNDGAARLWDTETGQEIRAFERHDSVVRSAVFSADEARVLTCYYDGTARLWDIETGYEIREFEGNGGKVGSAVFSADETRVLTGSDDGTARLWDTETGQEVRAFEGHRSGVRSAVFSANGTRVLTSSEDGTARLWDTETGHEVGAFIGHRVGVLSAVFSADGTRVLTGSFDCTAQLWDTETGQVIRAFVGHRNWVTSAVFSADETRVLTRSDDGTARLWDTETGQEIRAFVGNRDRCKRTVFSADETRVLTYSSDRTVRLFDTEAGESLAIVDLDYPPTAATLAGKYLVIGDGVGGVHFFRW